MNSPRPCAKPSCGQIPKSISVALLFAISLVFVSCDLEREKVVNIGLAINLSGFSGTPAEDIRDGALLAVKEINHGHSSPKLRLILKDDGNSRSKVVEADKQLIEAGCPVIIGHSNSQNTLTAYPVVTEAGRILITAYTATTKLSKKDDLFFRTSVDNYLNGKAFAKLLQTRGIKDILMVLDLSNPSFSVDLGERIKKAFSGSIKQIGIDTKKDVDWNGMVQRIINADPEAVIMITEVKSTAILCQKLRKGGYKGKFLGTVCAQDPYLLSYGGDAIEGLEIVSLMKPGYENVLYKQFERSMMKEFHKQATPKSARAYELIHIIHEAMNKCGPEASNPACIKNELLKGKYDFLLGTVQFDRFGDVDRPIYCITVKDGRFHFDHRIL